MGRSRVAGVALALGLIATGVAATVLHAPNAATAPTTNFSATAESTALFCTGLGVGTTSGRVVFTNLTGSSRVLVVTVTSNTGTRATRNVALSAHASSSVAPQTWVPGTLFGVSAIVNGGGVVGAEVAANNTAVAPCVAGGVTDWYAAGFDTLVGSSAVISLFNPSATPAVVNLTTVTASGFAAPAPFQGLAVGAHAEVAVNLGAQIVDTANVGVHVNVLRGSLAIVGVQTSGAATSFNVGQGALATSADFPLVTTAANTRAQVRIANPNDVSASVTVAVALGTYHIAPESVEIPAYASGVVTITPNSAIPAAGFAALTLTSSEPVTAALAVGSAGLTLSAPSPSSRTWLVADFSGRGFSRAVLSNTGTQSVRVLATNLATSTSFSGTLAAGASGDLRAILSGLVRLQGLTLLVTCDHPVQVTTILPLVPVGPVVASALNGG
ncbi:MAG: hypothetical protein KGJ39_01870 [Acidobacteriota bacterium]|nr:hypothetical protein [Acidobacteriota bacterium]